MKIKYYTEEQLELWEDESWYCQNCDQTYGLGFTNNEETEKGYFVLCPKCERNLERV